MRLSTLLLYLPLALAQAPVKSGDPILFGESGSYPRAIHLADGSLLGTYTRWDVNNHTLVTVHSTDSGTTWTPHGEITTEPTATHDLDNPYVHHMPNGQVLAAFRNHDRDASGWTHYRIVVCVSDDLGKTWRYLSTPAEMPAGPGIWEPFMQTSLDDSIQLYYSKETGPGGQDSIVRRTYDNGATWTEEQVFSGQDTNARDGMIAVAPLADRSPTKVAIFESGDTSKNPTEFSVITVRTNDDGATWEPTRIPVYTPSGFSAGAPQIIRVGNRLVASFGSNELGGTWPEGALQVMVSYDGGLTWSDRTTVKERPAMWSGMIHVDDDSFLALYESNGTCYAQKMVFQSA
ncbi:glycoside hydrolase family 93 protein [Periconia macrospinosa]|uniref:Glycoside hydrolase family 93 protein n=1 Tax=Periconia macrospinosa TaxID=97972 RepID=A0A2V1DK61_9PLEO|nr:glycoside hydrolase family 93 protein [Periconia macrospinosa]